MDWALTLRALTLRALTLRAVIAGGLAMGAWAMMMRLCGFTLLSVPEYLGRIMTGKNEGAGNYKVGMMLHVLLS